ncbi:disease resistance-responsive (dirigent-likeprotein) family protein [Striga asiatica]|uniref:Dirigent protein n=1 Tax=Striga asiatica TaxID=4170 RepID=A0A5A7PTA1_STRAF|nr:disease resistance-responsive (dirigent-likeprotein) family protein [Striga asiatica]
MAKSFINVGIIGTAIFISSSCLLMLFPATASKSRCQCKPKMTTREFYFHDLVSGRQPTAVPIAHPKKPFPNLFGYLVMIDDPLTEGPDIGSKAVGRAQGMYGGSGLETISLTMALTFVFDEDNSTLSMLGRNHITDNPREMPIIGGTGKFRMADGFALANTVSFTTQGDAVVHYNV